jgi:hypothetical protein
VRGKGGIINLPSNVMGFWREESERRVFVLRSDLVISELLNKFRTGYHLKEPKGIKNPF